MKNERKQEILSRVGKGLATGGAVALGLAAAMPGLRQELLYAAKRVAGKVPRDPGLGAPVPEYARETAREIVKQVRKAGIPLSEARIAVSGIGGSGKSTIARAIAEQMGTKAHELDVVKNSLLGGKRLGEFFKGTPVSNRNVFEQTHLLNKVDPGKFNVAIRVTTPVEKTMQQLLQRQRGAFQHDLYNIGKLDKVVRAAHETMGGKRLKGVGNVEIRVSTASNPFSDKALKEGLRMKGINPAGKTREEQLQSLVAGRSVSGAPGLHYFRKRRIAALAGIPTAAGVMAASRPNKDF